MRLSLPPDYRHFLLTQNGGLCPRKPEEGEDDGVADDIEFFSLGVAATVAAPHDEVRRDPERWMAEWLVLMRDLALQVEGAWGPGPGRSYRTCCRWPTCRWAGAADPAGRGARAVLHCYDPDGFEPGHVHRVARSFAGLIRNLDDFAWG